MIIWATAGKFYSNCYQDFLVCIKYVYVFYVVEPTKYLDMKWEPEKGKYFTPFTQKIYIFLFVLLNVIMFYWFAMIIRVILRVLQGKNAEDTRSDDEDEDE